MHRLVVALAVFLVGVGRTEAQGEERKLARAKEELARHKAELALTRELLSKCRVGVCQDTCEGENVITATAPDIDAVQAEKRHSACREELKQVNAILEELRAKHRATEAMCRVGGGSGLRYPLPIGVFLGTATCVFVAAVFTLLKRIASGSPGDLIRELTANDPQISDFVVRLECHMELARKRYQRDRWSRGYVRVAFGLAGVGFLTYGLLDTARGLLDGDDGWVVWAVKRILGRSGTAAVINGCLLFLSSSAFIACLAVVYSGACACFSNSQTYDEYEITSNHLHMLHKRLLNHLPQEDLRAPSTSLARVLGETADVLRDYDTRQSLRLESQPTPQVSQARITTPALE